MMGMGQNDFLIQAWQFKYPGDPDAWDGWAYNWDYAECSTCEPTAREGNATAYVTVNHTDDPVKDLRDFIRAFNATWLNGRPKLKLEMRPYDADEGRRKFTLTQQKDVVLTGDVSPNGDSSLADPNVGFYAIIQSKSMAGTALLFELQRSAKYGYICAMEQAKIAMDIGQGRQLVAITGYGPGDAQHIHETDKGLATRFFLYDNGTEVARCHLSYRDGSWDPSIGPTIEMIAVHKDHRGKGYLPLLWYWVKCFIQENFALECLNTDCPPGHIMIKATQLTNAVVDTYGSNGEGPITDKDFFYDYAGFSVRVQKGMGAFMSARRPRDEEAVLYIPLLTMAQLQQRGKTPPSQQAPSDVQAWKLNRGACSCEACRRIAVQMVRCGRCKLVYYCGRECQKRDWKQHKVWCGKTKDELHEILVEKGLRMKMPDGNWSTVMNG